MRADTLRGDRRRLRVYLSATVDALGAERTVARSAIEKLHLQPVVVEWDGRPHPRTDVQQILTSDIFIAVYGTGEGVADPREGTLQREFAAATSKPKLVYIKRTEGERAPEVDALIASITHTGALSYKNFTTTDELQGLIENDLALLLSEAYDSHAGSAGDTPVPRERMPLPHDLTPLIGREDEVREILDNVERGDARLITITGPGGIGKTSVTLQVAQRFRDKRDVAFVDLSAVAASDLVIPTIARSLGVTERTRSGLEDDVVHALSGRPTLLVLDNFERVLDAAPEVARLVDRVPDLKTIVTSRAVLRVRGEKAMTLAPLSFPPESGRMDPAAYPAVQLFLSRARAARPNVEFDAADLGAVAAICRRVDGLPLAIELAAARVRILSPRSILERLSDRFALLRSGPRDLPDRQRTLRATIDWSYELLDERERTVLARLAVFVGGRTLEGAEEVCDVDGTLDILAASASLIEKSLLRAVPSDPGEVRFSMLESVHAYAREQLEASGELEDLRRRHAYYFLQLARSACERVREADAPQWSARVERERPNLRAALAWAEREDATCFLTLVGALAPLWVTHGDLHEGLSWIERALRTNVDDDHLRAGVMLYAGELRWGSGQRDAAMSAYDECRILYERLDDEEGLDLALRGVGRIALDTGDYDTAHEVYTRSLEIRRAQGSLRGVAETLNNLGLVRSLRGDDVAALPLFEECLSLFHQLQDRQGVARADLNLSITLRGLGLLDRAERHAKESLTIWDELGGRWDTADCLDALAVLAVDRSRPREGLLLLGAAERLRSEIGAPRSPFDEPLVEEALARANELLEGSAGSVVAEGRSLELGEAVALALR